MNKEFERELNKRYPIIEEKRLCDEAHNDVIREKRKDFIDGYTLAQQGERERTLEFLSWLDGSRWRIDHREQKNHTDEELYDIYTQQLTQEKEK